MCCFNLNPCCNGNGNNGNNRDGNRIYIIERGPRGPRGFTGTTGAVGPIGPTGAQGPIGPQGPAGTNGTNGLASFGGAYSTLTTDVPLTTTASTLTLVSALPLSNVTVDTNSLTVTNAGTYQIDYGIRGSVSTDATITLSVTQNGADITQSVTTLTFTTTENELIGSTIATLSAGDVLRLSARSSVDTTLTLNDNVNTYLTIKQLTP